MNYYYIKNGETLGPLPVNDLVKIIDKDTLVWNEDGSIKDWLPARTVIDTNVFTSVSSVTNSTPKGSINSEHTKVKFKHYPYVTLSTILLITGVLYSIKLDNNFVDNKINWNLSHGCNEIGFDKDHIHHSLPWFLYPSYTFFVFSLVPIVVVLLFWWINFKNSQKLK